MTMTLDIHPWEKAGLGKAPFRFVGVTEKTYTACPGAPAVPAGTCDYCGNGILYCYGIRSADGKEFVVGCECVRKLDKNALVNATEFDKARLKLERDKRAAKRNVIHAREKARIDAAIALLDRPEVAAAVANIPHPNASMAKDGRTYADYIEYMRRMAGNSGMIRVAKVIESLA